MWKAATGTETKKRPGDFEDKPRKKKLKKKKPKKKRAKNKDEKDIGGASSEEVSS